MKRLLEFLSREAVRPALFEPGEPRFWDDPHISKSMLEAHLDPNHDAASRRPEAIDATVRNLLGSGVVKPGMKVLDLGCGPGLYAERFARAGARVDISSRSIEYARKSAKESGLEIDYHCMNFLDIGFTGEFDVVMQIYGELSVFPDDIRDELLRRIHGALKEGGVFVLDVTTRTLRAKRGLKNGWRLSEGGFWRPGMHLILEQGFDYPEEHVYVDQYIIVDEEGPKVYRNWYRDYSLETLEPVLKAEGFEVTHVWDDLTGSPYTGSGDWLAVVAARK